MFPITPAEANGLGVASNETPAMLRPVTLQIGNLISKGHGQLGRGPGNTGFFLTLGLERPRPRQRPRRVPRARGAPRKTPPPRPRPLRFGRPSKVAAEPAMGAEKRLRVGLWL